EAKTAGLDPAAVTRPTVSGSGRSLVPWSSLGREGRRHVLSRVPTRASGRVETASATGPTASASPRPFVDALVGPTADVTPDLSIETVMGQPAAGEPVQVYV